jgi:hypothetical protein
MCICAGLGRYISDADRTNAMFLRTHLKLDSVPADHSCMASFESELVKTGVEVCLPGNDAFAKLAAPCSAAPLDMSMPHLCSQ